MTRQTIFNLVVCVDVDRFDENRICDIGNQVEDLLKVIGNLVIHRKLTINNLNKIKQQLNKVHQSKHKRLDRRSIFVSKLELKIDYLIKFSI